MNFKDEKDNDFEEFLIYKEFMCFDRTIYYLLKNWCSMKDIELFFLDRYIGFNNDEKNGWTSSLDGLKNMLFNKGIIEVINIPISRMKDYISDDLSKDNFRVIAYAKFLYPDKDKPFPYTSYVVVEGYEDEYVILTKLSNVEQKIRYKEHEKNLEDILVHENGEVTLLVFRNSPIFEHIESLSCKDKIKYVLKDVFQYSEKFLDEKLNEIESGESAILNNLEFHKLRLEQYITEGVHRKNYSSFARRINEMIFPSFRCYNILKKEGLIINDELEVVKNKLENDLSLANKYALSFIWTKDKTYFTQYVEKMEEANEDYLLYRRKFHNQVKHHISHN
ncbi:hypothetical protein [Clostridium tunisiense]|uniref:hypothetical protein n=1 Tax=Clostridium tunisiense TaxID=219748 RepID=UPI0002D9A851|nr:hypothetical protein [Clostridium tunisiense]